MHFLLFVFLDGFGLGDANSTNPLFFHGCPKLEKRLGARLIKGIDIYENNVLVRGIDACLGIEGIPQSATGQTSLLTGQNAQAMLGYHLPAFPNEELVGIINEHSLLKTIVQKGYRATFANAYTEQYFEKAATRRYPHSVTTNCALAAELRFRTLCDLKKNEAVYWDITRSHLYKDAEKSFLQIRPADAARHLAELATIHEFTLFECFEPDLIGHKRSVLDALFFLDKIDRFLDELINRMGSNTTLLICSDHGNIEDLRNGTHTVNRVPLIVLGPGATYFSDVDRIDQVAGGVLKMFESTDVCFNESDREGVSLF
jgi:hypothetical protein